MKLVLALVAALRGEDDYNYHDEMDVDNLTVDQLMQLEDAGRWGNAQCVIPTTVGGRWHCRNAAAPAWGRKRRDSDGDDLGRWGQPGSTVQVSVCMLKCDHGWQIQGTAQAVCQLSNGYWRKPVMGKCVKQRRKCIDPTTSCGSMQCSGSDYDRQCIQVCPSTHQHQSRSTFTCHDGVWDGTPKPCVARNNCVIPTQHTEVWKGRYICQRRKCETGLPNTANFAGRRRRDANDGSEFNDDDLAHLEPYDFDAPAGNDTSDDRSMDFDGLDMSAVGKWGAPPPQNCETNECLVCYLKCNPIHQAKAGFRAQCNIQTGQWYEPMNPKCTFGHTCYWPDAGPMGEYQCEGNLEELGYTGPGSNPGKDKKKKSKDSRSEDWDPEDGEPYRGRREAESDGSDLGRWGAQPTMPPTQAPEKPTPAPWWGARWTCSLKCARFHHPKNNHGSCTCLLRTGKWSCPPTECVYKTPCEDPKPNGGVGVYQCWETTTLNIDGKIVRREANDTSSNPLGRWGAPDPAKPDVDKTKWDFNVQKICHLSCPDCYNPSQTKSICVNGEWQKGYGGDTFGRCVMQEKCPDRPWWPIGPGQWECNGFNNRQRQCNLKCDPFFIVQPLPEELPVPAILDPVLKYPPGGKEHIDKKCKAQMNIKNGWFECDTTKSVIDCMIMCDAGHRPISTTLYVICKNGMYFPAVPTKDESWRCTKGDCDYNLYGQACYDHPGNAEMHQKRKRRDAQAILDMVSGGTAQTANEAKNVQIDIALDMAASANKQQLPDNVYADDEANSIGRWGVQTSRAATCDNCNGYWQNQIHCVFNTRCPRPSAPANGSIQCSRDHDTKAMMHRCNVQCDADHKLWPPGCKMSCDPNSGVWNKCTCEWAKKCEEPKKPNAKYFCEDINGVYTCTLVCKGKGNYVPARWPDTWKFRCKRGSWIEREPQGCKYEPPCKPPNVKNAVLKNCRTERCLAPKTVWEEMMPGQYQYELAQKVEEANQAALNGAYGVPSNPTGMSASHVGYTGKDRKRRETVNGFFEGETYETQDDRAQVADLSSFSQVWRSRFGHCPSAKTVENGKIHCHTIISHDFATGQAMVSSTSGGITTGYNNGLATNHSPVVGGKCKKRMDMANGWMECKLNAGGYDWMCMIMCNNGYRPVHTSLMGTCNAGSIPGNWQCVPGFCDHALYKEACWTHPNNPWMGGSGMRKRREVPGIFNSMSPVELERQTALFNEWEYLNRERREDDEASDRWFPPVTQPPPPPVQIVHESAMCSLRCDYGFVPADNAEEDFLCDTVSGVFSPKTSKAGCVPAPTPKPTEQLVWATCMCCDAKCAKWHRNSGDEEAKCTKGYWWKLPQCDKYSMCKKPDNPEYGEYNCYWEDIDGDRKRRSADIDYERQDDYEDRGADGERQTVWLGTYDNVKASRSHAGTNGTDESIPHEIDGMTWGRGGKNVQNRKMVCNLKCDKGYKAKKKTASCVDGTWLNKPSTCVVKPFNPPESECELPKKANKNNEGTWSCKTVMLDPNERSVEQDLALYQEDGYEVITDESTIAGLTEKGNFMEEYEKGKNKKKAYVVCKLKCPKGHHIEGGKTAKCEMKSGSWVQQATGKCVESDLGEDDLNKCKIPKKAKPGHWHCGTAVYDKNNRGEDNMSADDFLAILGDTTMADVVKHKKKKKAKDNESNYLVCTLDCPDYYAASSNPAKCNADTGIWEVPKGHCYSTWSPAPECAIPNHPSNGWWSCATMLTDPNERESAKLPEMERVASGTTTADIVSRNTAMTERWYQYPTLEYMLVCQLSCDSMHWVYGDAVVKCNLDTGYWNKASPVCKSNAWTAEKKPTSSKKPSKSDDEEPKKKKKTKKDKKTKKPKPVKDGKPASSCDKDCLALKKKIKKIVKKCKKDPKLTACSKLDGLKNDLKAMKGLRSDEWDIVGDAPDNNDQFPEFPECDGSKKCEKRAWRSFCAENPFNVYC